MAITRSNSESILTVDTSELVVGTTYDLVIESYDENSSVKSALKTDTIQITIEAAAAATVPQSYAAPTTSIGGDLIDPTVIIDWEAPSDDDGLIITGYKLEIKISAGTFE